MTDYKSAKPVLLMPADTRVDVNALETGPVVDTIGWRKLWMLVNNGEVESGYGRFYLEFSADGTTFSRPQASAILLSGGVSLPELGAKQSIQSGWVDLTPEMRYIRVKYERPGVVVSGSEQPTAVTGILLDPISSTLADHVPFFKLDAHNRA